MTTRIPAADQRSRDLASVALAALEVADILSRRHGRGPDDVALRLAEAIALANPHPPLETCIGVAYELESLARRLAADERAPDQALMDAAQEILERAWLREHGTVPACYRRAI